MEDIVMNLFQVAGVGGAALYLGYKLLDKLIETFSGYVNQQQSVNQELVSIVEELATNVSVLNEKFDMYIDKEKKGGNK